MKPLNTTLPLTLALGGVVAVGAVALPLEPDARASVLIGALVASLLGGLAMVLKTLRSGEGMSGGAAVQSLLIAQASSFTLRLLGVAVGALALRQRGLSPVAFVIAFFIVSLAQQLLETRTLLASLTPVKSSKVIS